MFERQPVSSPQEHAMREPSPLRTLSSAGHVDIADSREPSTYLNGSMRSVTPASIRVEDLLRQAMALFETDRKTAWRCLRDASTLLGQDEQDPGIRAPGVDRLKRGGLAIWQAKTILAYIEANLASKMEIDDLANAIDLSRSHFSRAFKHCVGLPPMEYVAVRRVERAKSMISGTRESLAEVALACGFADQAHLSKRFREIIGISPGRWRRSNALAVKPSSPRTAALRTNVALRDRFTAEVG
jgi:AraC family transcriptional regulator